MLLDVDVRLKRTENSLHVLCDPGVCGTTQSTLKGLSAIKQRHGTGRGCVQSYRADL